MAGRCNKGGCDCTHFRLNPNGPANGTWRQCMCGHHLNYHDGGQNENCSIT